MRNGSGRWRCRLAQGAGDAESVKDQSVFFLLQSVLFTVWRLLLAAKESSRVINETDGIVTQNTIITVITLIKNRVCHVSEGV